MRIFSNSCEFHYAWDQITAANWRKYPNEMSTHVVAVDVLRRELDPTGTILTTERLITCKQSIPRWLNSLIGGKEVSYVREVSVVDMNKRTLTMRSVNLTMNHILKVYETVTYTPDAVNPHLTHFNQQAQITAYATFNRICNKLEEWSVERFGQNATKGKLGFEKVLDVLCDPVVVTESLDKVKIKTGELLNETFEKTEELINDADKVIDQTIKKTEELLSDADKILNKDVILRKTEELLSDADKVLIHTIEKTEELLNEAEHVKKSIVYEYYDIIKKAFKGDH